MCWPSTSASAMSTILWYLAFSVLKSSPMPAPNAVIIACTSLFAEGAVEARLLDVQDLAAQRQDRLRLGVAALHGGAAGRVALDDEDLGDRRVLRASSP